MCKYTSHNWGRTFMEDLMQPKQTTVDTTRLRKLHQSDLLPKYRDAKKRLILLGYEGILARAVSQWCTSFLVMFCRLFLIACVHRTNWKLAANCRRGACHNYRSQASCCWKDSDI